MLDHEYTVTFQEQIRNLIVKPSLLSVCLHSDAAEVLVYGTGLLESNYQYLVQIKGPALGMWQMEPETHKDIKKWLNLRMNSALLDRLLASCYYTALPADDQTLIHNLRYACLLARLQYFRVKTPLPRADDPEGLAKYYIVHYNAGGKAKMDVATDMFERIINGAPSKEVPLHS